MQTNFTLDQLSDPDIAESNAILRACVHCGFCTATCPTYALLGDELDSPRGRIYQIKDMLERDIPAPVETVKHLDRCLSCLSCMTTCPSGVHYMHLVDHARAHIEKTVRRPFMERSIRNLLALVLPRPFIFRLALIGAFFAKPIARFLPGALGAMFRMAPKSIAPPSYVDKPQVFSAIGKQRGRVALMNGCAQQVLAPEINEATVRILTRHGIEVVVADGAGCCGALVHHMGRMGDSLGQAARNIHAWSWEREVHGLDALIINTSGCGTMVKDYGFMFREDPILKEDAAWVSAMTKDVTEYLSTLNIPTKAPELLRVAYHSACSMQHGQKITEVPIQLLSNAGFDVVSPAEGHLCCGSAGTYNILEPEIADRLKERKIANLQAIEPQVIAAGNIGCIAQLGSGTALPVVHTVELLDWATGGQKPKRLN